MFKTFFIRVVLRLLTFPTNASACCTWHVQNYMTEHLLNGGNQNDASSPTPAAGAMIHMKKWMRTKTAIVFRLSSSVIQINFFNHTKLIINAPVGLPHFHSHTHTRTHTHTHTQLPSSSSSSSFSIIMMKNAKHSHSNHFLCRDWLLTPIPTYISLRFFRRPFFLARSGDVHRPAA